MGKCRLCDNDAGFGYDLCEEWLRIDTTHKNVEYVIDEITKFTDIPILV